jgi:hypothetical protein
VDKVAHEDLSLESNVGGDFLPEICLDVMWCIFHFSRIKTLCLYTINISHS